jgi:hypothetical protein
LGGLPVGNVRPPLTDPNSQQLDELRRILEIGDRLVAQLVAEPVAETA